MSNSDDEKRARFVIEREIFPEADKIFTTRYLSVEQVAGTCIIVLDTNALLIPFGTSPNSLSQIEQTYTPLVREGRLIIPGQVAREFARNRPVKLAELYQNVYRKRDIVTPKPAGNPLLGAVASYAEAEHLENEIRTLHKKYRETIRRVLAEIEGWVWDDPVSKMYASVFTSEVIHDPSFDEKEIQKQWEHMVSHKIPPGYKDGHKDSHKDSAGSGDFLIWKTILEIGIARRLPVVFVSGDQKADWRIRAESQVLYPRFELVDEFRRASDGSTFHILQFSEFLELFGADKSAVQEVQAREHVLVQDHLSYSSGRMVPALLAEQAVFRWLRERYSSYADISTETDSSWDGIYSEHGGVTFGVEVSYFRRHSRRRLRDLLNRAAEELGSDGAGVDNAWVFCVAGEECDVDVLVSDIRAVMPEPGNGPFLIAAKMGPLGELQVFDVMNVLYAF
jgi:hypothetical protein